jgi:hypothetical protein
LTDLEAIPTARCAHITGVQIISDFGQEYSRPAYSQIQLSEVSSLKQPNQSFQVYAVCIEDGNSQQTMLLWPLGNKKPNMTHITDKLPPKLRKAPQPPLSYPGATPDADHAKKPPLAEPSATNEELSPGDRVEGLGNFGKPNGAFGTVERANDEDAVVKWDDDGRERLPQPWLKKV